MGLRLINYVNNQQSSPALYTGVLSVRPDAGIYGRLFMSIDTKQIFQDLGTLWQVLADAGSGSGTLESVTANGNSSTYGISILSNNLSLTNSSSNFNYKAITTGSILFSGDSSGLITQDNSNLFWDNTNKRLGIRTNSPAAALDVTGSSAVVGIFNNSTTAATFLTFRTQTVDKWYIGNDHSNSDSYVIYDVTNTTNRLIITASGYTNLNTKLIVGNTTPSSTYQFDVYGSGRLTGALFTQSYFVAGGTALPTGWTGSIQTYSGLSSPSEAHIYNMGVVGTQLASSSNANVWGIGVYGAGYTNGGTRSAGVMGDGEVNASADTGSAIGVRGYATATHSGGLNIGMLSDASGSSTGNYGFYTNMAAGSTIWANYHAGTAQSYFGGNVGIGTSSPIALLNIYGSTHLQLQNATTGSTSTDGTRIQLSGNDLQIINRETADIISYTADTERMRITSGGNVLIGTTTDNGYKLQVNGTLTAATESNFTATSANTRILVTATGVANTVLGFNNSGSTATGVINNASYVGNLQAFPLIFITDATERMRISNVGVATIANLAGTGSRAVLADASGNLSAPVSDVTVKENIKTIGYGLNEIVKMNPVWFDYIDEYKNYGEGRQNGNIAQEMETIIPEAVFTTPSTGKMGINYDQLHAVYIKAIQELNEKLVRNNIN